MGAGEAVTQPRTVMIAGRYQTGKKTITSAYTGVAKDKLFSGTTKAFLSFFESGANVFNE